MEIKIAQFEDKHLRSVVEIEKKSFSKPWTKEMFEKEMELPNSFFYVALHKDKVIGYVGYWIVDDEAHMLNLAVKPAKRGKGVGKQLLEHIVSDAKTKRSKKMLLEVRESNASAQKLYESLGFFKVGKRKNYYGSESAVLMDLKIKNEKKK